MQVILTTTSTLNSRHRPAQEIGIDDLREMLPAGGLDPVFLKSSIEAVELHMGQGKIVFKSSSNTVIKVDMPKECLHELTRAGNNIDLVAIFRRYGSQNLSVISEMLDLRRQFDALTIEERSLETKSTKLQLEKQKCEAEIRDLKARKEVIKDQLKQLMRLVNAKTARIESLRKERELGA